MYLNQESWLYQQSAQLHMIWGVFAKICIEFNKICIIGVKICVYIYKCALNSKCKNRDQQNVNITQVKHQGAGNILVQCGVFHYNKKLQATCHINFLHILQYFFMKYFLFGCWICSPGKQSWWFTYKRVMKYLHVHCWIMFSWQVITTNWHANHEVHALLKHTPLPKMNLNAHDDVLTLLEHIPLVSTYMPMMMYLHAHDDVLTCPWWCTYTVETYLLVSYHYDVLKLLEHIS